MQSCSLLWSRPCPTESDRHAWAPQRLCRCRAAPGSRIRAHPLAGTGLLARLAHPWRGAWRLPDLPDQTCLRQVGALAARRLRHASASDVVPGCRFPESFACSGDSAPARPGNRLRLPGGLHNPPPLRSPALRMLPPGFPGPTVAVVHRAKNSGKRRPAPGRRPMRTGGLSRRALNLGTRHVFNFNCKGNGNDCHDPTRDDERGFGRAGADPGTGQATAGCNC